MGSAAIQSPLGAQTANEYRARALEAAKAKQWPDAIQLYRKALELDPKDAATHYNLGSILLAQINIKDALSELQTADRLRTGDAAIQCSLGRAYLQNAQPAEAIAQFRKCLPERPKDAEARYYDGIALGQEGRAKEAAAQFRQAIAIQPEFGPAHQSLGVALRRSGDEAHALDEFKVAAKLMPDNPIAWCDLGLALKSNDDTHAAIDAFRHALALRPDYERAQYGLGVALKKEGQNEAAAAQMQTVSKQHQQRALRDQARKLLLDGADFERKKQPEQAEAAYRQALELAPIPQPPTWPWGSCMPAAETPPRAPSSFDKLRSASPTPPMRTTITHWFWRDRGSLTRRRRNLRKRFR